MARRGAGCFTGIEGPAARARTKRAPGGRADKGFGRDHQLLATSMGGRVARQLPSMETGRLSGGQWYGGAGGGVGNQQASEKERWAMVPTKRRWGCGSACLHSQSGLGTDHPPKSCCLAPDYCWNHFPTRSLTTPPPYDKIPRL